MYTASQAALNFTYDSSAIDRDESSSFFKGDLYFDTELSFETLRQAVQLAYGLDQGNSSENECTWQQEDVRIVLSKKEKFTILEVTWLNNDGTKQTDTQPNNL